MTVTINTLEFARAFETAGFDHEQAGALAEAFGKAHDAGREELATKADLGLLKSELLKSLAEQSASLVKAIADQNVTLTKAIADNGKDISSRLWSTMTILVGTATAVSAAVGSAVTLLLKSRGL